MTDQKGKLVLYSGSSGVGKGTILKKLMELDENVRDNFKEKIASGGYLEYAEYCHNFYGTPIQQLRDLLDEGKTVFLEIEVEGALQVMKKYPDILSIFVLPPNFETLERRLRAAAQRTRRRSKGGSRRLRKRSAAAADTHTT